LFEKKTGKIITINGDGHLEKNWAIGRRFIITDGKIYNNFAVDRNWFCFGFLENKNENRKTRKKV
jgi:hypothetical protein